MKDRLFISSIEAFRIWAFQKSTCWSELFNSWHIGCLVPSSSLWALGALKGHTGLLAGCMILQSLILVLLQWLSLSVANFKVIHFLVDGYNLLLVGLTCRLCFLLSNEQQQQDTARYHNEMVSDMKNLNHESIHQLPKSLTTTTTDERNIFTIRLPE